jgi:hypothetical protein
LTTDIVRFQLREYGSPTLEKGRRSERTFLTEIRAMSRSRWFEGEDGSRTVSHRFDYESDLIEDELDEDWDEDAEDNWDDEDDDDWDDEDEEEEEEEWDDEDDDLF